MAKGRKTGGRKAGTPNKTTREIKELAGALVPEALTQLRRLLRAKGTAEPSRMRAIEVVFERAFGKPAQAVQHSGAIGTYDLSTLSDDEFDTIERILTTAAAKSSGYPGGED